MPTKEELQKAAEGAWDQRREQQAAAYLQFISPEKVKEREVTRMVAKLDSELSDKNKSSNKPYKP
jgi:hypothetical protein